MKYFAYGSNMNEEQMLSRCPDSKLIGRAVLRDYKIAFTIFSKKRNCGCADVIKSNGDEVWGLVYLVNESDIRLLDGFEGVPVHYVRLTTVVYIEDTPVQDVQIYTVLNPSEVALLPSKEYLKLIQDAASKYNFPKKYQEELNLVKTCN